MAAILHDDELPIDDQLVRRLVERDLPEYAELPLTRLGASGSTNALYRLGPELLVRLPRQPGNGASITKEQRWTPVLAAALPVAVPEIVALGEPGFGYPEPWSVVRWIDGTHPTSADPTAPPDPTRTGLAEGLAEVVAALRNVPVPAEAVGDPALRWYRGRALAEFDADFRRNLERCREITDLDLDLDAARALWERSLALPGATTAGPDRWYHGDLVAENLLVDHDRLVAVLDFGAVAVGDPTIDLHGAWEVLDPPARAVLQDRLGIDEAEWLRGRAWALGIALGAVGYYWDSMPGRRDDRLAMARNVLADAD